MTATRRGLPARKPARRKAKSRSRNPSHSHTLAFFVAGIGIILISAASIFLLLDYRHYVAGLRSQVFERIYPVEHFRAGQLRLNTELVSLLRNQAGVRNSDVTERKVEIRDAHGVYEKLHWRIIWRGGLSLTDLARHIESLSAQGECHVGVRRLESRQWGDYLYMELSIDGRVSHSILVTYETRRLEPEEIVGVRENAEPAQCRVAIVIDDVGYNLALTQGFLQIDVPLTFSVLPFLPESAASAEMVHRAGRDLMIHMPMEPRGYPQEDPGPGAILHGMDPEEVRAATIRAIDSMPFAIGMNNHMGSRITTNPILIGMVLRTIKERGLFYLDSRTTEKTVAYSMARSLGVPAATRQVFLDDVFDPYYIGKMIDELFAASLRNGSAIGIGHLNQITLEALQENLWKAARYNVRVCSMSEVIPR